MVSSDNLVGCLELCSVVLDGEEKYKAFTGVYSCNNAALFLYCSVYIHMWWQNLFFKAYPLNFLHS